MGTGDMSTGETAAREPKRLRNAILLGLVIAALVGGCVAYERRSNEQQLAANLAQLKGACGGMLPYSEVEDTVPEDKGGSVSQHGTMIEAGQEDRALLDCGIDWDEGRVLSVHAEALLGTLPEDIAAGDLVDGYRDDGATGAPGLIGGEHDDGVAWLLASCPKGLKGRVRTSQDLYVTASVTSPDDEPPTGATADEKTAAERAQLLKSFRVAARVANRIRAKQGCGGTDVAVPQRAVDREPGYLADASTKQCSWITPTVWETSGDVWGSSAMSACAGWRNDDYDADSDPKAVLDPIDTADEITGFDATSWSGVLGRTAVAEFLHSADRVGPVASAPPSPVATPSVSPDYGDDGGDDLELTLWAVSRCDGGTTYHSVDIRGDSATPAQLARAADEVMTRYLSAKQAWPTDTAHCHDSRVLGKAWSQE